MPKTDTDKDRYRDFAHTVRVIASRSIIEAELAGASSARGVTRFTVVRQAASATDQIEIPTDEIAANGGQLAATFALVGDQIRAMLQLKGFVAVKANAGKSGRLVAANGAFSIPVMFDERGRAECLLADSLDARHGLQNFHVEIDQQ